MLLGAMRAITIFSLATVVAVALTLQILSCALWSNWWPLLTGAMYVVVPMPMLFLASGGQEAGSYSLMGGGSDDWVDVAKFLTGACARAPQQRRRCAALTLRRGTGVGAVGTVGIPVVLTHAQLIEPTQLALALPSALLLGGTLVAYTLLSRNDDGGGFGYSY